MRNAIEVAAWFIFGVCFLVVVYILAVLEEVTSEYRKKK